MKDYKAQITYESLNNILDYATEREYDIEVEEGVLNDTYVIFVNKGMTVGKAKPRKYIVLYPKFANEWSNTFHILMTDDETKAQSFLK